MAALDEHLGRRGMSEEGSRTSRQTVGAGLEDHNQVVDLSVR